jgi:hypothetical protein
MSTWLPANKDRGSSHRVKGRRYPGRAPRAAFGREGVGERNLLQRWRSNLAGRTDIEQREESPQKAHQAIAASVRIGMPRKMKLVPLPSSLRQYEILRNSTCCRRVISAGVEVEKPLCCKRTSSGPHEVS